MDKLTKEEREDLLYMLSTLTVDLSLPQEHDPKWGHLSYQSADIIASGIENWYSILRQKRESDAAEEE